MSFVKSNVSAPPPPSESDAQVRTIIKSDGPRCNQTAAAMKHDPHLKIPKTRAEFAALDYASRLQLAREHPLTYECFTTLRKPWEE